MIDSNMWIKRLIFLAMMLSLSGCWLVFKPDIRQGNIIDSDKVNSIRVGMTPQQVIAIMGNPVMINPFTDNRLIYVYSLQPGHGKFMAKQLIVNFSAGRVTSYNTAGQYP